MFKIHRFINLRAVRDSSSLPWLVAFCFHALGAYFSEGYHHPDEHYQIWEWANYFVGLNPQGLNLPWEFTAEIRPWFQPLLHAGLIKFMMTLKLFNPFSTALIAREIYAGLNLLALKKVSDSFLRGDALNRGAQSTPPLNTKLTAWIIATLWFFPYIHARTSSENLAGIFLTFAFAAYFSKRLRFMGLLLGFSFLARYQIALGLVGLGLYFLVLKKFKDLLQLAPGFLIAVGLGVLLDRWGYGHWVFTPYRYFDVNITQGVSLKFNPYPWYQYFVWIAELNPLVSIPLCVGLFHYVKKFKVDALVAFMGTFFILHCFMGNKEYRFLFPILNFLPLMVTLGWKHFYPKLWALINIPGIIISSFHITAYTIWPLFAFYHYFEPGSANSSAQTSPAHWLTNHGAFDVQYYTVPKDLHFESFVGLDDLKPLYEKMEKPIWIVWDDRPSNAPFEETKAFLDQRCELKHTSLPECIFKWREKISPVKRLPYQAVYFCK